MRKHSVHAHDPRRLAAWKRNLVGAVAVATLAATTVAAGTGMATAGTAKYVDPTYAVGTPCPGSDEMVKAASDAYLNDPDGFIANDIVKNPVGDKYTPADAFKNQPRSVYNIARNLGLADLYNQGYFGFDKKTGKPIDIALVDTGVAPVPGLDSGNVAHGPDLSFDSQSPALAHLDGHGHGTHLSSIMVGRDNANSDPNQPNGAYSWKDPKSFTGLAPGARVISMKAGSADGTTDPTQVIAAIDWVVKHRSDPGLNIRVINLSYGLNSPLAGSFKNDALSYAIEQAYNAGIVVVAAAGNEGAAKERDPASPLLKMGVAGPAFNPNVIAVGANDWPASLKAPWFSQTASEKNRRAVDFTAPGVSILGLHDTGSAQDDAVTDQCKETMAGDLDKGIPPSDWTQPVVGPNGRFIRGSGTSQAAAVVSAVVAVLLSRATSASPAPNVALDGDWAKAVLKRSAIASQPIPPSVEGQGRICVSCALRVVATSTSQANGVAVGGAPIDATRAAIDDRDYLWDGTPLKGDIDIFGNPVSPSTLAYLQAVDRKTGAYSYEYLGSPWQAQFDGTETWGRYRSFRSATNLVAHPVLGLAVPVLDWSKYPDTDHIWSGASFPVLGTNGSKQFVVKRWVDSGFVTKRWVDSGFVTKRWVDSGYVTKRWVGSDWAEASWA